MVLAGGCSILGSTQMGGGDGGHQACTQVSWFNHETGTPSLSPPAACG